jgi:hypothetical protein
MAVTIHNLDVRFDVEGEGDEKVFAKMFATYARRWDQERNEQTARQKYSDSERTLGDRPEEVA